MRGANRDSKNKCNIKIKNRTKELKLKKIKTKIKLNKILGNIRKFKQ